MSIQWSTELGGLRLEGDKDDDEIRLYFPGGEGTSVPLEEGTMKLRIFLAYAEQILISRMTR